ncbi:valine--tRNA ligase [Patescibacteria group bacterium]|nr:valine--tRNA ligase [Patescibacteria group bacterium]MCH8889255.1 valine--tRNA ligase [Patescibacteria group bacterium]
MHEKFLKPYNPKETESKIYNAWEKSGFFNPDKLPKRHKEPFTVTLPPPNVTGILHIGHAYESSLQDAVVRYKRMLGKKVLWVPGTDSAAIATQARVEKNIKKEEKKTRHDLGRDELVKRVEKYAKESESTILNQIRKMGSSLDWSRYAYTLDEKRSEAVATAFKRMYDAGLIYRGHRIINWDPKGQTTISDDEVVYKEEASKFYYLQYGPFVIGTARPETKFGDKYVVIHPDDSRYKNYKHGDTFELEWINGPITATIIKDEASDIEIGSGVMTITPSHSAIDFEIAERHNLDKEQIIDKYGKLLPIAGEFEGMKISDAREKIVEKLQKKGLVVKVDEKYIHNVATSERTVAIIEPQIMEQWFIAVDKKFTIPHSEIPGIKSGSEITLKQLMRIAVQSGAIEMPQRRFKKIYFHWIDNLHDWCISRQIWFGHRIPVWYKEGDVYCGLEAPKGAGWKQDTDVLDTWFSSALWTFSTLGWPRQTKDLKTFHPTSFMSPAYEILPLWVSRMILMSGFHLGQVPFETVMIHGLVRDKSGRKFSKSLGNGIDPIDMIDKYGADALRMGLLVGTAIGNDINFDESKVKGYKHFANKIWNVTRFVLENTEDVDMSKKPKLLDKDEKRIKELSLLVQEITKDMDSFRFYLAAEKIYHYFWHRFADVIIEESKGVLGNGSETEKVSVAWTLNHILETSLKLLHPFMPFITEEIWLHLDNKKNMLIVESWPDTK